jgi:hypothetical protein
MGDDANGPGHVHRFTLTSTIEGCHWARVIAHCHCGARLEQHNERKPATDPHAWEMLDPSCERCSQLIGGARPEHRRHLEPAP